MSKETEEKIRALAGKMVLRECPLRTLPGKLPIQVRDCWELVHLGCPIKPIEPLFHFALFLTWLYASRKDSAPTACILDLAEFLIAKNRKYGDSALNPTRFFSTASPSEQILIRMDDKLSRLESAQTDDDEDALLDLTGYAWLLALTGEP